MRGRMSLRASEVVAEPDGRHFRHQGVAGSGHRLVGALLRDGGDGAARRPAAVIGTAWRDPAGAIVWGWPDDDGGTPLRPAPEGSWKACLLPPALSLVLAMRRRGTDLGARALVLGEGIKARLALAVAVTLGCRGSLWSEPSDVVMPGGRKPEIVIETTGDAAQLDRALACCRDWGVVYSMGGGLASGPQDYYQHVHRRALTVFHVPECPVMLPGEAAIAARGVDLLMAAVEGIAIATGEWVPAVVQPGECPARLYRERGPWSVLEVAAGGAQS